MIFIIILFCASLVWLVSLAITFFKSMVETENPSAGMKMWLQLYIAAVLPKALVSFPLPSSLVWIARLSYLSLIVFFYSFYQAIEYIKQ